MFSQLHGEINFCNLSIFIFYILLGLIDNKASLKYFTHSYFAQEEVLNDIWIVSIQQLSLQWQVKTFLLHLIFRRVFYQNGWHGDFMEAVWRLIFNGDFLVKLVWGLSEVFMEKTRYIKLQNNLHTRYHSPYYLHTVYIILTFFGDNTFFLCHNINGGGENNHAADNICKMIESLIDNIFVLFGGSLVRQVIGLLE